MELPDRPSHLIAVALRDLESAEADPAHYWVNMGIWHERIGGRCHVCLAGAVMAFSLGCVKAFAVPEQFPSGITRKLKALDRLRKGEVGAALSHLGAIPTGHFAPASWPVALYRDHPEGFKRDMQGLADHLAGIGL